MIMIRKYFQERLCIQTAIEKKDSFGVKTLQWKDKGTFWGKLVLHSSSAAFPAQRGKKSNRLWCVTIRYTRDFYGLPIYTKIKARGKIYVGVTTPKPSVCGKWLEWFVRLE